MLRSSMFLLAALAFCWSVFLRVKTTATTRLRPPSPAFLFLRVCRAILNRSQRNHAAQGVFTIFGLFGLVCCTFVVLNIPETKGVPLEQMDALFAGFNGGTISGLFELIKSGGKVRLCSTAYCGWLEVRSLSCLSHRSEARTRHTMA